MDNQLLNNKENIQAFKTRIQQNSIKFKSTQHNLPSPHSQHHKLKQIGENGYQINFQYNNAWKTNSLQQKQIHAFKLRIQRIHVQKPRPQKEKAKTGNNMNFKYNDACKTNFVKIKQIHAHLKRELN